MHRSPLDVLIEVVIVFADVFGVQLAGHGAVGPARVDQNQRQQQKRHEEHDFKGKLRACAVPDGQTRTRIA